MDNINQTKDKMTNILGPLALRMIISGPSGSGKGILVSQILLKHYRGKFEKIYYFQHQAKSMII